MVVSYVDILPIAKAIQIGGNTILTSEPDLFPLSWSVQSIFSANGDHEEYIDWNCLLRILDLALGASVIKPFIQGCNAVIILTSIFDELPKFLIPAHYIIIIFWGGNNSLYG